MKIFISHSSKDIVLLEKFITLLRNSLNLAPGDIRCSCIDGHRLQSGVFVENQLRNEVNNADILIAIISRDSIKSIWFLLEVGARWGMAKKIIPVLLPGVSPSILKGPLGSLNHLKINENAQISQVIDNVADLLKIQPAPAHVYLNDINNLVDFFKKKPIMLKKIKIIVTIVAILIILFVSLVIISRFINPSEVIIREGEEFNSTSYQDIIKYRNASGQKVLHLQNNDHAQYRVLIPRDNYYEMIIKYSNDDPDNDLADIISITIDGVYISDVELYNSRNKASPPGSGWERFISTDPIDLGFLSKGNKTIEFRVKNDEGYGIALDVFIIKPK